MPREYARRRITTWDDDDFKSLDLAHQGLFDALCAYPKISWCGVIDYIPRRLVECSHGLTETRLTKMIDLLVRRNFLVLDDEFGELLVRTFVRHDGVLRMTNMGKSCAEAYRKVHSPNVKQVIVTELGKLWIDQPELKGWAGMAASNPSLYDEVTGVSSTDPLFNTSPNT